MEKSQTNATNATIPPLKSQASNLTKHLNTHNGGKLNKCNQCDYASFQAVNLKKRLKTQDAIHKKLPKLWTFSVLGGPVVGG